jgi:hypothetical protein
LTIAVGFRPFFQKIAYSNSDFAFSIPFLRWIHASSAP